jgi:hypothetical protein
MDIELGGIRNPGGEYEYILLKVNRDCNLSKFVIYDTTYDDEGNVSNKLPHFYRFPDYNVKASNTPLIRLYTSMSYKIQEWVDPKKVNNLILSWRLNETIWNKEGDKATLIEIANEEELVYKNQ